MQTITTTTSTAITPPVNNKFNIYIFEVVLENRAWCTKQRAMRGDKEGQDMYSQLVKYLW